MTVAVGHLIVGFGREPVIGVDSDSPALLSFVSHYRPRVSFSGLADTRLKVATGSYTADNSRGRHSGSERLSILLAHATPSQCPS